MYHYIQRRQPTAFHPRVLNRDVAQPQLQRMASACFSHEFVLRFVCQMIKAEVFGICTKQR